MDEYERTLRTVAPTGVHRTFVELVEHQKGALQVGRVLGRGGMATVSEARQTAMRRVVAVKHTEEAAPDDDRDALIQEAWLTGALEHPNIVPLHDIRIVDGEPHVVMKKIDGVPWRNLLRRPGLVEQRFGVTDALSWHLQTLVTVCRAIEYAHSRGILHLDLKPANVMIGDYGEVYVVDWGIAVAYRDDNAAGLQVERTADEPFGTPAYMAPEMAIPGSVLSPSTDVFMLAGILYRIVTGSMPRTGTSSREVLAKLRRPVPVGEHVPLRELLEAGLALEPARRPPSVADFRQGLLDFLEHRGAIELARRSSLQLVELTERIGAGAPRAELYDLFGACRFGFEQALEAWPALHDAAHGRQQAIALMARHELDAGDDRAAGLLVRLLDDPGELEARLETVRDERMSERAALHRLQSDLDPRTAWAPRLGVALLVSFVFVLTPIGTAIVGLPQGYAREVGIAGSTFVLVCLLFAVLWRSLVRSRFGRLLMTAATVGPGAVVLLHGGCWLAGMPSELAGTLELFVYFLMAAFASLLADWRFVPSALGYLTAYYLSMSMEGTTLLWMNIANLIVFVNILLVWVPTGVEAEPDRPPLI